MLSSESTASVLKSFSVDESQNSQIIFSCIVFNLEMRLQDNMCDSIITCFIFTLAPPLLILRFASLKFPLAFREGSYWVANILSAEQRQTRKPVPGQGCQGDSLRPGSRQTRMILEIVTQDTELV